MTRPSFRVTSWYDVISSPGLIILLDIVTRASFNVTGH